MFKDLPKTHQGLRKLEQKLNDEITICSLGMDFIQLDGFENEGNKGTDRKLSGNDRRLYGVLLSKIIKLQDKRGQVRGKLRSEFPDDCESVEALHDKHGFPNDTITRYFL